LDRRQTLSLQSSAVHQGALVGGSLVDHRGGSGRQPGVMHSQLWSTMHENDGT
jgi:hypothetical protein